MAAPTRHLDAAGAHAARECRGTTCRWLLQTKGLIEIVFANILLDKQLITSETFTALLLMAVVSTMLSVPVVAPKLRRLHEKASDLPAAGVRTDAA